MAEAQPRPSAFVAVKDWIAREPLVAILSAAIIAIVVYFFGFLPLFVKGEQSTLAWAWQSWNPETNYEHAKLIPLIVAFVVWHSRDKLKAAPLGSSKWGWLFIGLGIFLFLAGARTIQARLSL
ncbi:MAG: exosortase/archaeosortase family protein, partial [Verrucomicrobiota bacterium]|nr:exosortase/archaeosortase family protein [Verrucomicrobiota bacterium]